MAERKLHSASAVLKRTDAELDSRVRRALEEEMDVLFVGIGTYVVHSESGNRYEIDVFERSCTCPDWKNRVTPTRCKHLLRVDLEIDAGTVPRPDGRIVDRSTKTHPRETSFSKDEPTTTSWNDGRIIGPIPEFDCYGRSTGVTFWRCRTCGRESIRRRDLDREVCDCYDEPA